MHPGTDVYKELAFVEVLLVCRRRSPLLDACLGDLVKGRRKRVGHGQERVWWVDSSDKPALVGKVEVLYLD